MKEHSDDGSDIRFAVGDSGNVLMYDTSEVLRLAVTASGVSKNTVAALDLSHGAVIPAGQKLVTPEVEAEGTSGRLDLDGPAAGSVRFNVDGAATGVINTSGLTSV